LSSTSNTLNLYACCRIIVHESLIDSLYTHPCYLCIHTTVIKNFKFFIIVIHTYLYIKYLCVYVYVQYYMGTIEERFLIKCLRHNQLLPSASKYTCLTILFCGLTADTYLFSNNSFGRIIPFLHHEIRTTLKTVPTTVFGFTERLFFTSLVFSLEPRAFIFKELPGFIMQLPGYYFNR